MTRTAGRLLAVYLVGLVGLAMLATNTGFVGVAAGAAGNTAPDCSTVSYADGDMDGYLDVDTVDKLQCIENEGLSKDYELTSDIDASGTDQWNGGSGFEPIGAANTGLTGTFAGRDHTISGLYINRGSSDYIGLFARVGTGGRVEAVGVENVDITGDRYVGGLVGLNYDTVTTSYVTGSISGDRYVGGLVGDNRGGTVSKSYANVTVSGDRYVGGLVGNSRGTVTASYANGSISANYFVGGLLGYNDGGTVSTSYATGTVSGSGNVGGLVGYSNSGTTTNSYWDTESSGKGSSAGGTGLTTSQMQESSASSNMAGFDFSSNWDTVVSGGDAAADGYPILSALDRQAQLEAQGIYNAPPSVSSITRSSPSSPTNSNSVDYTVTFSESVTGVDTGDFTATGVTNTVSGSISGVSGPGSSYTVTVSSISGDGNLRLDLNDDDSITDGNSYELGGTGTSGDTDGSYTSGETFSIDNTDPGFSAGSSNSVSVDEGTTPSDFLDVDAGDDGPPGSEVSTYALSSAAGSDADDFSVDSSTGKLSLDGALDHESPTDDDGNNDYELTVTATDDVGNTNTQTVTVDVTDVDEPPTASDDSSQSTHEDSTVSVANGDSADLLALASDPDAGDTLSFDSIDGSSFSDGTPVTLGSGATVTVNSDGSWTYDPNGQYESLGSGDSTTDSFTYTVADSDDDTAEGTVTISIAGVNDAPTGTTLSSTSVAQSGGTDAVVGTLSATDPDDSSHTFSLVSGSGDGDNAEFTIDDGDLRADDASALAEGDYDVRIEAGDGSGGTYEKQFIVTVTDDIVPTIASSTPADDATGVHEGDDITLSFSEDIAFGSGSITLRENDGGFSDWETFDASSDTGGGDGTVAVSGRTLTIDSESDLHSDTEYAVRVDAGTLTDTAESSNDFGGITDDTTLSFTTTDSIPPTASVGPDTTVDEDISVSFDGSGSTDNVNVDGYEWDWTGDGNYEGSGQTASHTYADLGTYTVTLRVTDGYGNTDTAQRAVTVADTGGGGGGGYYDNTDPTARTQPNVTIDAGTTLDFDGSNSMDNDELDSYRWDFDGDGNYEESGVTVSRNYTASGVYTVTLRVTDDYGNTDTTERVVTVVDATPPTAVTQSNVTVEAGTAVTFDAANSTDNENITSYEWDFAGDGTYDASGITANHSYVDHGTYNATLRVIDGENNTDTAQRTVTVQARNGSGENTSSDAGSGEDGDDDSSDEGTANGDQGTESGTVDSGDDQVATATAPTTAAPTVNTESVETADSETTQQETTTGGSGPLSPMLAVVSIVLALFVYRQ